ncbi:isochorismatase family protein [Alicyclobacillus sp. SO9]|uniref:isochorismatase family protein n=1 Tax=Alicyclobacillus sp. SO9 TaxID=2665646 RepID=UPI0018E7A0F1|nr:isochorismatase family protein [Alicyclobacillus sp. SO9]QQE80016.1 isochorismatase family protein [Alicyclobacillus sp. SO9]
MAQQFKRFDGFGGSSGVGRHPAILVVDYIQGFTDASCQLGSNFDKEVTACRQLLDPARVKSVPVIFTTVFYEDVREGGHFLEKVPALKQLVPGSPFIEVDHRLGRNSGSEPLIVKKFASAFFGTHLQSLLTTMQIDTLIVTGCTTSGCVRASVVDALQFGYRVVVPRECVGDRSAAAHEANLYDIQTKYGDVVGLESVQEFFQSL